MPLKKVLSVSSEVSHYLILTIILCNIFVQDSVHTASSLLSPSGLQWLSAGNYRGNKTEVDLELAKLTRVARVEIGKQ